MSQNDAPAAPDYTPIANAQLASARMSDKLSREQFDWAKQAYADNKATSDRVANSQLAIGETNAANAAADRARYQNEFQPLEDSLAADARDYASDSRRDLEMGRAQSGVAQNMDAQRQNAQRDLESFGINPGSTRFAALDLNSRIQQGAAEAAAGNQASQYVDATGRALRSEAINVGRGYPGQIAGTYNTALQGNQGAVNTNLSTTASGANTMGTGVQWNGQAANSYTGAANTMNTGFSNQMSQYNANTAANNSTMQGIGQIAGLGAGLFLAEGGEVPDEVSPTAGKAVDDVPAKLTAGEFIIPKHAVDWFGQKHFYDLMKKADTQRDEAMHVHKAIPAPHTIEAQRHMFRGGAVQPRARAQALQVS